MSEYVLVWPGEKPRNITLTASEAECTRYADCGQAGVIYDSEYGEPWCQRHADEFTGDEAVIGPEIVEVGSARYAEILAKP